MILNRDFLFGATLGLSWMLLLSCVAFGAEIAPGCDLRSDSAYLDLSRRHRLAQDRADEADRQLKRFQAMFKGTQEPLVSEPLPNQYLVSVNGKVEFAVILKTTPLLTLDSVSTYAAQAELAFLAFRPRASLSEEVDREIAHVALVRHLAREEARLFEALRVQRQIGQCDTHLSPALRAAIANTPLALALSRWNSAAAAGIIPSSLPRSLLSTVLEKSISPENYDLSLYHGHAPSPSDPRVIPARAAR
jgi:hypothetical protein